VHRDRVLGVSPRHGERAVHVARVPQNKVHRVAADRGGECGSRPKFKNTKCIRKKVRHCSENSTLSRVCSRHPARDHQVPGIAGAGVVLSVGVSLALTRGIKASACSIAAL